MNITAGTWLGSYEALALIGVGGVDKTHDTKLGRDLANKIRPKRPLPW